MRIMSKNESMFCMKALVLLSLATGTAQGATWTGTTGATNAWETAGNWNPSGAPAGVYVLINNGGAARITTAIVTNSHVTVGSSVGSGYVIQDGGALTLTNAASPSYIGNTGTGVYTLNAGTLTVKGPSTTTPTLHVGYASGGTGALHIASGGTVAVGGELRLGSYPNTTSRNGNGTAVVNAGTLTVSGSLYDAVYGTGSLIVSNNGTANIAGSLWTAYYSGDTGTITVASGGTLNVANSLRVGQGGYGTMTVDGGTVNATNSTDGIWLAINDSALGNLIIRDGVVNAYKVGYSYAGSNTGQVFLCGGTLAVGAGGIVGRYPSTSRVQNFQFDGGTLLNGAGANNTNLMTLGNTYANFVNVTVTTNGAIIDDGGYEVTISSVLKDAPGQIGKLTKKGTGTLTLSATNTFSGDVTITAGTLALNQMLSTNVCVTIATGATNNLAFTGTNTIRMLSVNGELLQPNRVYGANNNGGARDLSPALSGGGYYYTTEGAPPKGTMIRFL
ncbi:MAG: autotransporter-associated beta strand repeat-containing protein [bacterium]